MAESKPKKDEGSKVMDVNKPGKAAPDASARPIIVTHKPMAQDPMVSAKSNTAASDMNASDSSKLTPRHGTTIKPPSETEIPEGGGIDWDSDAPTPAAETATSDKPTPKPPATSTDVPEVEVAPKPAEKTEPEPPAKPKEPKTVEGEGTEEGAVEALAGEAEAKKKEKELSAEEKATQEAVQKLIESRKYNVHISQPKSKMAMHALIVILVVCLVAAIGLMLAIDAELIDFGIPPITNLIN